MNKMKKAAANLERHLGADTNGINLMNALLRVTNDIRKELASTQVTLEKKEKAIELLKSHINKLTEKNNCLAQELHTSRAVISNQNSELLEKQHEIDSLEKVLDPPINIPRKNKLTNKAQFKALFKSIRKKIPKPPPPIGVCPTVNLANRAYVFSLSDFVNEYNQEQYLHLGMFVTVCNIMNWPVAFYNEKPTPNLTTTDWAGGESGRFLRWVRETWLQNEPAWREEIAIKCFNLSPNSILEQKNTYIQEGI